MKIAPRLLILALALISIEVSAQVDFVTIQMKSSYAAGWGSQRTKLVSLIPNYAPVLDGKDDFTRYGTYRYLRTDSTGYFYVKKIDGRWWLVDPNGYAGINMAVTSFGNSNIQNDYDLVRNLGYNGTGNFVSTEGQTMTTYNPYNYNLFSYTRKLNFFSGYKNVRYTAAYYPNTPTIAQGSVDHVTVFDPKFVTFCDLTAKNIAQPAVNERDLLGYFTDNEINFNADQLQNIVNDLPAGDPSRDSALVYAASKGLTASDITTPTSKLTDAVKQGFAAALATRYFKVVSEAIHKYDTNHLIIGSRLHGSARSNLGVVAASQNYMDVTSVNFYDRSSPNDQIASATWTNDKPCLVTEFYIKDINIFPVSQSGAGWYVNSQAMRGNWYQNTCLELLKSTNYIGWQYFRFQDDTDSNKGIVNASGNEYSGMTLLMNELNKQVYQLCDFYDGKTRRPASTIKTKVFSASDDTYVIPGVTSTTNFGTETEMEIRNNARETSIRESFLKFDLSSVKDSLNFLKHAQLEVYCTSSDATARSMYVSGVSDNNWQELTLTGALRSANTNWSSKNDRLIPPQTVVAAGPLSFDVTTWVAEQTKNGFFSFKIHDLTLTNTSVKIASREYADQAKTPKLTLQFYVPNSTSFQSLNTDADYVLYPNPSSNKMTIAGNDILEAEFITIDGQSLRISGKNEIDVSAFPKGIYLVKIKTNDGRVVVRKSVKI